MIKSIYGLTPVNKTAAVVTGQAGCDDELTPDQKRDALVARSRQIKEIFTTNKMKKSDPARIELVAEVTRIDLEISSINKELNKKPRYRDISPFFLVAAKEEMTKAQYDRLIKKASELGNRYDWSTDKMNIDLD